MDNEKIKEIIINELEQFKINKTVIITMHLDAIEKSQTDNQIEEHVHALLNCPELFRFSRVKFHMAVSLAMEGFHSPIHEDVLRFWQSGTGAANTYIDYLCTSKVPVKEIKRFFRFFEAKLADNCLDPQEASQLKRLAQILYRRTNDKRYSLIAIYSNAYLPFSMKTPEIAEELIILHKKIKTWKDSSGMVTYLICLCQQRACVYNSYIKNWRTEAQDTSNYMGVSSFSIDEQTNNDTFEIKPYDSVNHVLAEYHAINPYATAIKQQKQLLEMVRYGLTREFFFPILRLFEGTFRFNAKFLNKIEGFYNDAMDAAAMININHILSEKAVSVSAQVENTNFSDNIEDEFRDSTFENCL